MAQVDWNAVGTRISLLRTRKGQSIRAVAEQAQVDKNTVMRLEKGHPVRMNTLDRICTALGTSLGRQMLDLPEPTQSIRISKAKDRRWEKAPDRTDISNPQEESNALKSDRARWLLGWSGQEGGFNGFLDCELFAGSMVSSLIELFVPSTLRSFPGEELIFCVRGSVQLQAGPETVLLEEGDAACLKAHLPKTCAPATPVSPHRPPPMILSVRVENRPPNRNT